MPYEMKKLTPNLIVSNVEQSIAFYCDVLGFTVTVTVPETSPYVFAIVQSGPVEFSQRPRASVEDIPFREGDWRHADALHGSIGCGTDLRRSEERVKVTMPLEKKFYGVTEFAFEDPDGYVITFAERTA